MSKQEILAELTAKGQHTEFKRSPAWEKAFDLYNKVHSSRKNMNCGSCFRDVLAWLRS